MSTTEYESEVKKDASQTVKKSEYPLEIKWLNIFNLLAIHILGAIGAYLFFMVCKWQTMVACYALQVISGMGITAGAHRLWAHRTYKAKLPLRLLLVFLNTVALQTDIYAWCRDHRMHHKFSETDADPHNSNRGFFFAHVGWLMCKKHPDITTKGHAVDLSDVLADPVVQFQRRFYIPLGLICWLVLPTLFPVYMWNETPLNAMFVCVFFRYVCILHCTWSVNSVAHMFGHQQYDKSINPRESSFVAYASYGEGYHNYHHVFPSDYSTSELDWRYNFNFSTAFIDFFAMIGWAYDLKRISPEAIQRRAERTGDALDEDMARRRKYGDSAIKSLIIATGHLWIPVLFRVVVGNLH